MKKWISQKTNKQSYRINSIIFSNDYNLTKRMELSRNGFPSNALIGDDDSRIAEYSSSDKVDVRLP